MMRIHPALTWLSILTISSMVGCRFGNRTVVPQRISDGISGYYATAAEGLTLYATTHETLTKEAPPLSAPQDIASYFSNPVALMLLNTNGAEALIFPPNSKSGIPVQFDSKTLSFSYIGGLKPRVLWTNPECLITTEILIEGAILKSDPPIEPTTGEYPVSGRLKTKIQVIHNLTGDCGTSLSEIAACYQNPEHCGGSSSLENLKLSEQTQDLLSSWVKAKAIDLEQLSVLQNFAYALSYD